jgi:hypothetical protein
MRQVLGLFRFALFVSSFAAAPSVLAQSEHNPHAIEILPAEPVAGQKFIVRWDAPDCVYVWKLRSATLVGQRLLMLVEYIEPLPGLPGCTGALRRHEWAIGPFPAGDFTFELLGIHPFFNERTGDLATFALTIRPFVAPAPNVVSTGSASGWLVLTLMLGIAAVRFLRERLRA